MKEKLTRGNVERRYFKVDSIAKKIVEKTKLIQDCVIWDKEGTLNESKINFERILKYVGDWTGYEVSCNELRFSEREVPINQIINLAKILSARLSQEYQEKKFVIIISVYDETIDLRFHTYREDEKPWLDDDLNKYEAAILCLK